MYIEKLAASKKGEKSIHLNVWGRTLRNPKCLPIVRLFDTQPLENSENRSWIWFETQTMTKLLRRPRSDITG